MSTLGFEMDLPWMQWSSSQLDHESLSNIIIGKADAPDDTILAHIITARSFSTFTYHKQ